MNHFEQKFDKAIDELSSYVSKGVEWNSTTSEGLGLHDDILTGALVHAMLQTKRLMKTKRGQQCCFSILQLMREQQKEQLRLQRETRAMEGASESLSFGEEKGEKGEKVEEKKATEGKVEKVEEKGEKVEEKKVKEEKGEKVEKKEVKEAKKGQIRPKSQRKLNERPKVQKNN